MSPPRRQGASPFLESINWETTVYASSPRGVIGGDIRRITSTPYHLLTTTMAFRASAWPSLTLCTPSFARHYRRFTTQNRAPGRVQRQKFGITRASDPLRIY